MCTYTFHCKYTCTNVTKLHILVANKYSCVQVLDLCFSFLLPLPVVSSFPPCLLLPLSYWFLFLPSSHPTSFLPSPRPTHRRVSFEAEKIGSKNQSWLEMYASVCIVCACVCVCMCVCVCVCSGSCVYIGILDYLICSLPHLCVCFGPILWVFFFYLPSPVYVLAPSCKFFPSFLCMFLVPLC